MKVIHLLLVALFACTLGMSVSTGEAYAASAKKEAAVPTDTVKMSKATSAAKKEIPHDVNINTADKELLAELPGIGPVTADAIIEYRNTKGQFKSIDELTEVKGIGDKTLMKIKPYLQNI